MQFDELSQFCFLAGAWQSRKPSRHGPQLFLSPACSRIRRREARWLRCAQVTQHCWAGSVSGSVLSSTQTFFFFSFFTQPFLNRPSFSSLPILSHPLPQLIKLIPTSGNKGGFPLLPPLSPPASARTVLCLPVPCYVELSWVLECILFYLLRMSLANLPSLPSSHRWIFPSPYRQGDHFSSWGFVFALPSLYLQCYSRKYLHRLFLHFLGIFACTWHPDHMI